MLMRIQIEHENGHTETWRFRRFADGGWGCTEVQIPGYVKCYCPPVRVPAPQPEACPHLRPLTWEQMATRISGVVSVAWKREPYEWWAADRAAEAVAEGRYEPDRELLGHFVDVPNLVTVGYLDGIEVAFDADGRMTRIDTPSEGNEQ